MPDVSSCGLVTSVKFSENAVPSGFVSTAGTEEAPAGRSAHTAAAITRTAAQAPAAGNTHLRRPGSFSQRAAANLITGFGAGGAGGAGEGSSAGLESLGSSGAGGTSGAGDGSSFSPFPAGSAGSGSLLGGVTASYTASWNSFIVWKRSSALTSSPCRIACSNSGGMWTPRVDGATRSSSSIRSSASGGR